MLGARILHLHGGLHGAQRRQDKFRNTNACMDPAKFAQQSLRVLAQLRVEDAAQPSHDRGTHVLVGLLVGDEVNESGVPGGSGQRDVVSSVRSGLGARRARLFQRHRPDHHSESAALPCRKKWSGTTFSQGPKRDFVQKRVTCDTQGATCDTEGKLALDPYKSMARVHEHLPQAHTP